MNIVNDKMSDTPETDAKWQELCCSNLSWYHIAENFKAHCQEKERERDEVREQVKELIYISERAIALAEIDFENDKFGVVSELRDGLEKIKKGAK